MIDGASPFVQAFVGTLFTWFLTAAGSALVFIFQSGQRKILDGSLGFAAGVMTAASYWSLLAPAIEMASTSSLYGTNGEYAFFPVAVGFVAGALFVYLADITMPCMKGTSIYIPAGSPSHPNSNKKEHFLETNHILSSNNSSTELHLRKKIATQNEEEYNKINQKETSNNVLENSWRRIYLLIIAITIHNIPEGLAVGVGFGAIGKSASATFENARNLAIGIGIQNFPEGLAVSLPLRGAGLSVWKSFWYGQLSGMVEPLSGIFGAMAVVVAEPLLPYALAFAAGAMIFVVLDDIIPEAQICGNGKLASWGAVLGFVVMMSLDVALG